MASLINRISRFARSPQGRRLKSRAMTMAKDPKTRSKIQQFRRGRAARRH